MDLTDVNCGVDGWAHLVAVIGCCDRELFGWEFAIRGRAEAKREIRQWIEWYNARRPHQSPGCKSPREYRAHSSGSVA
jgi:putative transposase